MRLRSYFIVMALGVIMAGVFVFVMASECRDWTFFVSEGVILILLALLAVAYRKVVRPLNVISGGMDLLAQQDFASRLRPVGQVDADRIVAMFNSMMEQLKAQRLYVRERNEFLDLLINASPMGVVIFDDQSRISSANVAAARLLSVRDANDLVGLRLSDLPGSLACAADRIPPRCSDTIRLDDSRIYRCSRLSFMDCGWPHPFMLIESLTDEVMAAEKLAYGKVIRMIAHEVNNTMGGVESTIATVGDLLGTDPGNSDLAEALSACADRCRSMTGFISGFADVVKIPEPVRSTVRLNDFVAARKPFLESLGSGRGVGMTFHPSADDGVCARIDTMLMEQVLVNIVKNSVESIGAAGGHIDIAVTSVPCAVVVTDNGTGISDETAAHLFSPFYSTKPGGQGLGLMLVADILKKHRCEFSLATSAADGLTRFTIRFPSF